jgi:hypothetical protein
MSEDETERLQENEPWKRYVIRQLFGLARQVFNQKIMLAVISVVSIWIAARQQINSGKQDTIIAKADTVAAKQVKIDSTTTVQSKGSIRRDSINKVFNTKLDLLLHYDSIQLHLKPK